MTPGDVSIANAATDAASHRWSLSTRILFRFAFLYFGIYCLANGNATIFSSLPVVGESAQDVFGRAFLLPAQYLARHLFHVAPPGDTIHPTGSGDTAIDWIACLLMLLLSVVAGALWSLLDRKRLNYGTMSASLRFLIRLTLGLGMVTYGIAKVFPMQMPVPSIASLAEPLGMHSPMALLWSFIGANPVYEIICGSAELLAGLLLLVRRTALMGALLTAFVGTNILLYNLCYDVPVKLYAAHLVLLSIFVVLPDGGALFRFFWLHQEARPTAIWVPPASRPWFLRTTIAVEIVFTVLTLGGTIYETGTFWRDRQKELAAPSPLRGAWHVDEATRAGVPHPVLDKDGNAFAEMDVEVPTRASFRSDYGEVTWFRAKTDVANHTLQLIRPDGSTFLYRFALARPDSLTLTPLGPDAVTGSTLELSLVNPPEGYPLLHRGFHWVSEFPYQR